MFGQEPDPPAEPRSKLIVTLAPLRENGPAALAPAPELGILQAVLVEQGLSWHNAFNELTIRAADDLFACAAQDGAWYDATPKGAELIEARIELYLTDATEPRWVELKPPNGLLLQCAQDRERVLRFLTARGFVK